MPLYIKLYDDVNVDRSVLEKLSDYGAIHHSFVVYDMDIKALKFFADNVGVKYIEL